MRRVIIGRYAQHALKRGAAFVVTRVVHERATEIAISSDILGIELQDVAAVMYHLVGAARVERAFQLGEILSQADVWHEAPIGQFKPRIMADCTTTISRGVLRRCNKIPIFLGSRSKSQQRSPKTAAILSSCRSLADFLILVKLPQRRSVYTT